MHHKILIKYQHQHNRMLVGHSSQSNHFLNGVLFFFPLRLIYLSESERAQVEGQGETEKISSRL